MEQRIAIDETVELSEFQTGDKANLLLYLNDTELNRNTLRVPFPYTQKDADDWMILVEKNRSDHGAVINWAIRHREAGVIGGIGAFVKNGIAGHSDEIGYWMAAPFRGKGIMTRVLERYTEHLFASRPPLIRIEAWVFEHNRASLRVLEKAGFRQEGFARKMYIKNGQPLDAYLLGKLRDDT